MVCDLTRRIAIKGYKLDKTGKLVPCHEHLPVNLRLQKQACRRACQVSRNRAEGASQTQGARLVRGR